MSYNKNVVEDALFQIKNLEETLQENAKGILQSTMSEEIRQLVKESLKEQEDEVKEPDAEDETDVDMEMEPVDDEMDDEDMEMDDEEMDTDDEDMDADMDADMEMDTDMDDEEAIDMTDASDAEVLRVFKAMGDDDGIVVKKEGGYLRVTDDDDDYLIQLSEQDEYQDPDMEEDYDMAEVNEWGASEYSDYEMEFGDDDDEISMYGKKFEKPKMGHKEETIYEIMMDDHQSLDEYSDPEMEEMYDPEVDEQTVPSQNALNAIADLEEEMAMKEPMEGYYNMDEQGDYGNSDEDRNEGAWWLEEQGDYGNSDEDRNEGAWWLEESSKSKKPKGVGIGRGPKFGYNKKPNMSGGFSEKKKEAFGKGIKAMGTGKAKFTYKDGENVNKGKNTMVKKMETKEASRTYGNGSKEGRGLRKARLNNRNYEYNPFKLSESHSNNQVQLLREKNEEYKKALDVFRTKLNEVAVFNSNLAYATRLFTEHSTTKQEKINILRRFDNVESLKESKNLYRSIKNELSSNGSVGEQKINESIDRAVNRTVETGSSVNLIESKTYENPQFLRMKDLMTKLK